MRSDKTQVSGLTTRQKVTAGVLVIVVIVVVWQIIGLFRSSKPAPSAIQATNPAVNPMQAAMPKPAELVSKEPAPLSPRELELMRLQQETQAKYLEALNELQMLKINREIAETTQAIAKAKLATVTDEKSIVSMLTPPTALPADYARGLVNAGGPPNMPPLQTPTAQVVPTATTYTVISVSQLQYRWGAVLGAQGNLYNVSAGDILPLDGSKVISIDKTGVVLEKDGVRKKVSLVPII